MHIQPRHAQHNTMGANMPIYYLIYVHYTSYVHKHIYIVGMRSEEVSKRATTCERSILDKITISDVMLMLHRFCWYFGGGGLSCSW